MPAAVAIPLIVAAASAGTSVAAAKMQSNSNKRALDASQQGDASQLVYLREQAAEDKRRYDQQQAEQRAQWDAEQSRRAPYREAAAMTIARMTGQPYRAPTAPVYGSGPMPGTNGMAMSIGSMPSGTSQPSNQLAATPGLQAPQLTLADALGRR